MLDNFRKKEPSRAAAPAQSPYARMQEALSHAAPGAEDAKPEPARTEAARVETVPSAAAVKAEDHASKLIVGPDIKLKGAEITDCNTLVVEGRVEAAMESRVLQVAQVGEFIGKAAVDSAEIRGRFDGELTARRQLVIRSTGRVSGKVRYGKLSIEEGGELAGEVEAIGAEGGSAEARAALVGKAYAASR